MTQPTEGEILKTYETDEGSMSLSCTRRGQHGRQTRGSPLRTGTFFWVRTTAQSLPLTPIDVMFAAVMALNAYSVTFHQPCAFVSWGATTTYRLGTDDPGRRRW